MNPAPLEGAAWSGRAGGLLRTFVEAAYQTEELRQLLGSDPAKALRERHWEYDAVPESLPPPANAVSVIIDDASLLGPVRWRTEPDKELLQQTQLRLLLAGVKPLALIHGDERSLTALASWARARGYFTLLGPDEFLPQSDKYKGGYSNRMTKVASACAGSGAWRGLLIAPDEQTVLMAWLCQLFGWESFLGRLLGYPPCCCKAFESHWPAAASNYEGDVGLMLLSESKSEAKQQVYTLGWGTNIFARYFGWEIIQHFPCRWDCPATATLSQRYFSVLTHYWPADARETLRHLTSPLLVIPNHGYVLFPGGRVVVDDTVTSLFYEPELAQIIGMNDVLIQEILSSPRLGADKNGGWRIAGDNVPGWLLDTRLDQAV